ncbi:MAG: transposase, partial [Planctomycetes bacterium]|nr:transposase [Planctomycetota bacterium]
MHLMGEGQGQASDAGGWLFEPEFNRAIKLRQADPRITSNAEPYLKRPPGRPPKEGDEFAVELGSYQAGEWTRPYRVVLVVIDLPDPKTGLRELFPHYFFLVTNWRIEQRGGWALVEHYRQRGTFEDRLGEFNGAIGNGLSAGSFAANEASLLLKLLAFNLAGMLRG